MAVYAVSFEIKYDSTYSERYKSLIDKINEIATGNVWDETTSFVAFNSNLKIDEVHHALYFGTDLLGDDKLLILQPTGGSYRQRNAKYPSILKGILEG